MKQIISIIILVFFASSAFAGAVYKCVGINQDGKASMTLDFESNKKVLVETDDDSEYTLDFSSKNRRFKLFADYGYDGYGGSVVLRVPAVFSMSGSEAVEEFRTRLNVEIYSELGRVARKYFSGKCQLTDN